MQHIQEMVCTQIYFEYRFMHLKSHKCSGVYWSASLLDLQHQFPTFDMELQLFEKLEIHQNDGTYFNYYNLKSSMYMIMKAGEECRNFHDRSISRIFFGSRIWMELGNFFWYRTQKRTAQSSVLYLCLLKEDTYTQFAYFFDLF